MPAMALISHPTPVLVGGRNTQSLRKGLWKRQRSNFGGRRTLSQNTTIIVLTNERWVCVCLPSRQRPLEKPLRGLQGYFAGGVGGGEVDDDDFVPIIVF